jgi:hypothetical protein
MVIESEDPIGGAMRQCVKPRAKVFAASQPFEPVMWSIGIVLTAAIISLAWLS